MTMRATLPARRWMLWVLLLLLLFGATMAIALHRRGSSQPADYRPASVEPAQPLTLTNRRAA